MIRQKVVRPVLNLLRAGATPERLAWSLALGVVAGINPLFGTTTMLALAFAAIFRLNVVASQIANHASGPLELLLFPVFIKLGSVLFGTPGLPLGKKAFFDAVKQHPWATTRALWTWEWHAMIVWAIFSCVAAPVLALLLRPALRRALEHLQKRHAVEEPAPISPV